MFPIDVNDLLGRKLAENRRPPDGKLHASGDLTGSLRHCQLKAAGAPMLPPDMVSEVNLAVGTLLHRWFEDVVFAGQPIMREVKLDRWLPEGWSGTADWVAFDADRGAFVLGDLKSSKPGAIDFIHRDGVKESHHWQASAYWHALARMGIPLVDGFCVYYLPKTQRLAREGPPVMPVMMQGDVLAADVVFERMARRKAAVDRYLEEVRTRHAIVGREMFLCESLAPVQPRELKLSLNKTLKRPAIDVKLAPNWSVDYCEFDNTLCNCREQGVNKIGSWDRDEAGKMVYTPSPNVAQPEDPEALRPSDVLVAALVKAQAEKAA